MKLNDFLNLMEEIAPANLAREGDNVGLLIGTDRTEIRRVLVALDCTVPVAREAVARDVDLVLCHHPLFYMPVRHFTPDSVDTAAAYILARHGIAMFAAHTNLDAATGGVNDCLADLLGLTEIVPLPPEDLGRIGRLETPLTLAAFAAQSGQALRSAPRYCGDPNALVTRIALVGGGGGSEIAAALAASADVLVTGELRHDQAIAATTQGLAVVALGHHETEAVVIQPLISRLQKAGNGVEYLETTSGRVVLACPGNEERNA
ncbi:MAG: Nif3-like dinuclear metal center hexameric protein [Clostridiales bacterium]|nr:Nif3-like dinuclear metal center hexameric protein [Clostridiales bacterium]